MTPPVRLTQYSSGAGCGCKISPKVLDEILAGTGDAAPSDLRLIIGNEMRDDAAAWLLDDGDDWSIPVGLITSLDDIHYPIEMSRKGFRDLDVRFV